ncbi:hypothetical protein CYMTET_46218, partial [Cymbomonas tetramitiformis]
VVLILIPALKGVGYRRGLRYGEDICLVQEALYAGCTTLKVYTYAYMGIRLAQGGCQPERLPPSTTRPLPPPTVPPLQGGATSAAQIAEGARGDCQAREPLREDALWLGGRAFADIDDVKCFCSALLREAEAPVVLTGEDAPRSPPRRQPGLRASREGSPRPEPRG